MSGESITAWRSQVTHELLLRMQQSVPEKHRPSVAAMDHVGLYLATCLKNGKGYVDETEQQIAIGLHKSWSPSTIGDALKALREVWRPITRGAKGHGTRRVFVFYDPKNLLPDSTTERDYPTEKNTETKRDYPAKTETKKDGIAMTTERDYTETERGCPVTPELPDYAPSASAETASVRSPEASAQQVTQPTPRCTVCAAALTEQQQDLASRLIIACKVGDFRLSVRAQQCIAVLIKHHPELSEEQYLKVLRNVAKVAAQARTPYQFSPHDDCLQFVATRDSKTQKPAQNFRSPTSTKAG